MRCLSLLTILATAPACSAADLQKLPANTFVEIEYETRQFPGAGEKGRFAP
jgi:hypothetical protein